MERDVGAGRVEVVARSAVVRRFRLAAPCDYIISAMAVANCCTVECDRAIKGGEEKTANGDDIVVAVTSDNEEVQWYQRLKLLRCSY